MILAHGGEAVLPAPDWLLAYAAVALVLIATVAARATLPSARQRDREPRVRSATDRAGGRVGLVLYALIVAIAITGSDTAGGNLAPLTVLSLWWVGMPILAALTGDVMAIVGPFETAARWLRLPQSSERPIPLWAPAALMALVGWFSIAYHSPSDPRSLAIGLIAYAVLVLAGTVVWGRRWLREGEPFAVLSSAFAGAIRGRRPPASAATTAVACVWAGITLFEAVLATRLWVDVQGTRVGWSRTIVDTAGVAWVIALVAAVHLCATRLVEPTAGVERDRAVRSLVAIPVLVSLGWVVAHEGPALVINGQNALALASDPFGRGWDLFGTIDRPVDYSLLTPSREGQLQLAVLAATHVSAVVLAVRTLRDEVGAAVHRVAWIAGGEVALALVVGVLVLVGGGSG